jgi:hypothetical protein
LLFAIAEDDAGARWFGTRLVSTFPVGTEMDIVLDRRSVGHWTYESGATMAVWRQVDVQNPSRQTVNAEVRGHSDAGVLSFELDESLHVRYEDIPEKDILFDPNGDFDRYAAEIGARYYGDAATVYRNNGHGDWPVPVYPMFERFEDEFQTYAPKPIRNPVDENTLKFVAALMGFALPPVGVLATVYLNSVTVARALFDPGRTRHEVKKSTDAGVDLDANDLLPSVWSKPNTLFHKRVPVTVNAEYEESTKAYVRGRWRTETPEEGRFVEEIREGFELEPTRLSPLDGGEE